MIISSNTRVQYNLEHLNKSGILGLNSFTISSSNFCIDFGNVITKLNISHNVGNLIF
jgi:hypothetical protein